jgi:hypothetical protein
MIGTNILKVEDGARVEVREGKGELLFFKINIIILWL